MSILTIRDEGSSLDIKVIACAAATAAIATLFVAVRLYTRRRLVKAVGIDDWFILVALLMSIATSVAIYRQTYVISGQALEDLSPQQVTDYRQTVWFTTLFYNLTLAFTKVSILLLYHRMYAYGRFLGLFRGSLLIVAIGSAGVFASMMGACIPLHKFWDGDMDGICLPIGVSWGVTGFNIASAFWLWVLPLPLVFNLRWETRQKLGLVVIFSLGLCACLMAVVHMTWIKNISGSEAFTHDYQTITYWSSTEINTAIVCACLATLDPLLHKHITVRRSMMLLEAGSANRAMTATPSSVKPLMRDPTEALNAWPPRPETWPHHGGMVDGDEGMRLRTLMSRESELYSSPTKVSANPTPLPQARLADDTTSLSRFSQDTMHHRVW